MVFSHDDLRLASASYKTVELWEVKSSALLHTLLGHTKSICSVAFSPDNHCLVSASKDNTLKLWNVGQSFNGATFRGATGLSNGQIYGLVQAGACDPRQASDEDDYKEASNSMNLSDDSYVNGAAIAPLAQIEVLDLGLD